jgi:hypothetical protein
VSKTQSDLEAQLAQRQIQINAELISSQEAFGTMEDWIIHLGERKAFLHPNLKQWMWYDKPHDEWVFAGCGVGEAILLTLGRIGGVKKLPKLGKVADWCVYLKGGDIHGPLLIEDLRNRLESGELPDDIQIWSALAADWFSGDSDVAQQVIFHDPSEDRTIMRS